MSSRKLDIANVQLDRVLGFFARVDSKASFLFAFNTTTLGIAALNFDVPDIYKWYIAISAAMFLILVAIVFYLLYVCMFPHLNGGSQSLIYFREIAGRTESKFIDEFVWSTDEEIAKDVLGQVWRNAEILRIKFDAIKNAFIVTIISLIPFVWCLIASSIAHPHVPLLK
jgi:hypothetical protein